MKYLKAVKHFEKLGYAVESGPREDETTLRKREVDYESTYVVNNDDLPGMAQLSAEILTLRQPDLELVA